MSLYVHDTFVHVHRPVPVCVCFNTLVGCVTKPSPVLSHLNNYCARLSCWPVGTLRRLNSTLCLVYKTTAGHTGDHGCPLQHGHNTLLHLVFLNSQIKCHSFMSIWWHPEIGSLVKEIIRASTSKGYSFCPHFLAFTTFSSDELWQERQVE